MYSNTSQTAVPNSRNSLTRGTFYKHPNSRFLLFSMPQKSRVWRYYCSCRYTFSSFIDAGVVLQIPLPFVPNSGFYFNPRGWLGNTLHCQKNLCTFYFILYKFCGFFCLFACFFAIFLHLNVAILNNNFTIHFPEFCKLLQKKFKFLQKNF